MIKINKDITLAQTPQSLKPAFKENFAPRNIPGPCSLTSKRRNELIRRGAYTDTNVYNSRYKKKDIKSKLKVIYKHKCAYCEQRVEQFHVEHYRPKQTYYWIAFSWDNLLSACDDCNQFKGTNFRINGAQATFVVGLNSIKGINTLSNGYDATEQPDLVNPEVTDPTGHLFFDKDGSITSPDPRFDYTITTCQIDRQYLRDYRKEVFDDLIADLKEEITQSSDKAEQRIAIDAIVRKFIRASQKPTNEYLAFRKFVIDNWLKQEIKNLSI
jgi:uncharacterized protein (TIGR02646 family)